MKDLFQRNDTIYVKELPLIVKMNRNESNRKSIVKNSLISDQKFDIFCWNLKILIYKTMSEVVIIGLWGLCRKKSPGIGSTVYLLINK